jgi:peroxiredoxin 2/4
MGNECCGGECGCGSGGGGLMVGRPAPDFKTAAYFKGYGGEGYGEVSLADYKGKWLFLFFYPLDFTFICPTEITAMSDALGEFKARGCEVLGGSCDSRESHKAWVERGDLGDLKFPLFADYTKEIAWKYGVLESSSGIAFRGSFIISPEGRLNYVCVHDLDVGRSVEETLRVLDALQNGGLCPANWKKGEKTL